MSEEASQERTPDQPPPSRATEGNPPDSIALLRKARKCGCGCGDYLPQRRTPAMRYLPNHNPFSKGKLKRTATATKTKELNEAIRDQQSEIVCQRLRRMVDQELVRWLTKGVPDHNDMGDPFIRRPNNAEMNTIIRRTEQLEKKHAKKSKDKPAAAGPSSLMDELEKRTGDGSLRISEAG